MKILNKNRTSDAPANPWLTFEEVIAILVIVGFVIVVILFVIVAIIFLGTVLHWLHDYYLSQQPRLVPVEK